MDYLDFVSIEISLSMYALLKNAEAENYATLAWSR